MNRQHIVAVRREHDDLPRLLPATVPYADAVLNASRAALLPLARTLQSRYGLSDEFVTELSVALPLIQEEFNLSPESIARALQDAGRAAREANETVRRQCLAHAAQYERHRQLRPRIGALLGTITAEVAR